MQLEDGTTLNRMLMQIYGFDPNASRSSRARCRSALAAVREIPFQWNTEALTLCLDQMTARGAPEPLNDAFFATNRTAVGQAVDAALDRTPRGTSLRRP